MGIKPLGDIRMYTHKTFDQLINERRSIRKYLDKEVETHKIRAMLEAARLAPSACNAQPWRFIVVGQKEIKDKIIERGLGGVVSNSWAKTAPVIIVACSDLSLFTHHLAERVQGVHYHLIDMGIALEHMVLKATELDMGTCYIGWFNAKEIKHILSLPYSWKVECLLTLGYPCDTPNPTPRKNIEDISIFK